MNNDDEAPSERWRRVERVYLSALARKDVERSALLDDLCSGDETLRQEVESLLRVQPAARSFLDTGAMAVAAEIMRGEVGTDSSDRRSTATRSPVGSGRAVWARSIARTTAGWDVTWRSRYCRWSWPTIRIA